MKVKGRKVVIGLGISVALVVAGAGIQTFRSLTPYAIYGSDANAENVVLRSRVLIPKRLPILRKLRILARALSEREFRSLPIEILRIEDRGGKQVAVVDLRETERNRQIFREFRRLWAKGRGPQANKLLRNREGYPWMTGFFEGSSGGSMTQGSLCNTFLQPDREGDWIDGVLFLYEGAPAPELDHIALQQVQWREELRVGLRGRRLP